MRSRNQSTGENKSLFPDREVRCWHLLALLFQPDFFLCKWQYPVSCSCDKTPRLDNSKDSSKPRFKLIMPGRSQVAGTWRRCHPQPRAGREWIYAGSHLAQSIFFFTQSRTQPQAMAPPASRLGLPTSIPYRHAKAKPCRQSPSETIFPWDSILWPVDQEGKNHKQWWKVFDKKINRLDGMKYTKA